MNAIAQNSYTQALHQLGRRLPVPKAILVVSAHWQSDRTLLQSSAQPETIHDFYGFPKQLFDVRYPARGAPAIAARTRALFAPEDRVELTEDWGLDHGAWSVLRHLYPNADIPVFQMSLSTHLTFDGHLARAAQLKALRDEGVLILGSGNLVHNLRVLDWQNEDKGFDWAAEFDHWVAKALTARDLPALTRFAGLSEVQVRQAHPTLEHYAPILYTMGVLDPADEVQFPYEGLQNGSISMRSVLIGAP